METSGCYAGCFPVLRKAVFRSAKDGLCCVVFKVMGLWGCGVMGLCGYGVVGLWGFTVMGFYGYAVIGLWGYEVMGL